LLSHACIGNPIAISRDGKIVMLSPNELFALLRESDPESPSSSSKQKQIVLACRPHFEPHNGESLHSVLTLRTVRSAI